MGSLGACGLRSSGKWRAFISSHWCGCGGTSTQASVGSRFSSPTMTAIGMKLLPTSPGGSSAAQNDQVSHRHLLATRLGRIECRLHALERIENLTKLGRLVDLPLALRGQAQAGTIGTATLVRTAIG